MTWTSNGFSTAPAFIDWSSTGIVGIDQFHKIWHASSGTGVQLIDGDNANNSKNVGSLGKVDSLAVGAPNDVWITTNGTTFQFDARWLEDSNVDPWISRNMGTQMRSSMSESTDTSGVSAPTVASSAGSACAP
ncbi:MAG: hypothetical protein WDN08_04690 [Rhizomicrobium sp.]